MLIKQSANTAEEEEEEEEITIHIKQQTTKTGFIWYQSGVCLYMTNHHQQGLPTGAVVSCPIPPLFPGFLKMKWIKNVQTCLLSLSLSLSPHTHTHTYTHTIALLMHSS
jgi:hypothetical protein